MKPLTKKEILKRHKKNPKDKQLQKDIETKEIKRSDFDKLVQQSTKKKHLIRREKVIKFVTLAIRSNF